MSAKGWDPLQALDVGQRQRLREYGVLLRQFNRSINLISREDETAVDVHHVLHCLALTHRRFPAGSAVVDWGTGGGLPAIPLAIAFPDVSVFAVDAVEKKIQAVRAMARRLGVSNLEAWHGRAETWPGVVAYSVSRATAPLLDLWTWHVKVRRAGADPGEGCWTPGLVCLKGGDLREEITALQASYPGTAVRETRLSSLFGGPYFAEKVVLEVFEPGPVGGAEEG